MQIIITSWYEQHKRFGTVVKKKKVNTTNSATDYNRKNSQVPNDWK